MDEASQDQESWLSRMVKPRNSITPALVGSILCWLALPPVGWSYLAWVGPIPWLLLIVQPLLPGRRPYRALWLGGIVYWLLAAHWIRLPHPANYIAWVALAAYLGMYLPAFVALSRVGVHRLRMPLVLVAPVVWVGLDWLRGWLLTGFSMCSLCHSQAIHPWVIQIADLGGEYLVTFVLVLVAACLTSLIGELFSDSEARRPMTRMLVAPLLAITVLCGTAFYHSFRLAELAVQNRGEHRTARIALIQGNTLADWKSDPAKQQQIMDEYIGLSVEAVSKHAEVDLVIWPETAFRQSLLTVEPGYSPPVELVPPPHLEASTNYLKLLVERLEAAVFVGVDRIHILPGDEESPSFLGHNSSVMIDKDGNRVGTYDKMHLVPFGEYIPLANWIPLLYRITPVTGGAQPGAAPAGLLMDDVLYVPNICYESAVPRLIRRQVNAVAAEFERRPDVLVNLTNDAWYWGSSQLDLHLACSVFRAVEMRIPHVIAANGGLSAHIDSFGTVQQVSERQTPTYLVADVQVRDRAATFYNRWGDWLAIPCVLCCVVLAVYGKGFHRSTKR